MRYLWTVLLVLVVIACEAQSNAKPQNTDLRTIGLLVKPVDGEALKVEVELAQTQEEHAVGLMNRKSMPQMHGMLFVWAEPRRNIFWMKDTLIPLDMLFIKEGKVVWIAPMTKPLDETPIDPGMDSDSVLEMNGGWAAAHGVTPGTELSVDR